MKLAMALVVFCAGCSTGVIKDDWTKLLIGQSGYIREPVQIVKDDKKKWSSFDEFKRCEPSEIVEARAYGKNTGLVVKQNGKLFYIFSAHNFVNEFKANPSQGKLETYLTPSIDEALGEKKTVKLTTGTHDSHQLQCESTYWKGMTRQQLIFVKGQPDQINKIGAKEQWTYKQSERNASFDLVNDVVTGWQD